MSSLWTIELFGGLCARCGEERIPRFATQKTAALLAYLAYHRQQMHPRETLIEMLWPECEPGLGRNRLNTLLSFVRRCLEPPGTPPGTVVQADRYQARLNPDVVTTDVAEFDRLLDLAYRSGGGGLPLLPPLREAIALYRGELLPGFYEEWIGPEQARLNERYAEALHQLARSLEQHGALEEALEATQKVLGVDPFREPSYRLQMRLYAALGQASSSQQTYQTLEQRLKRLGVAPSPSTRELAEKIRRDPQAVVRVRETTAVVTPMSPLSPKASGSFKGTEAGSSVITSLPESAAVTSLPDSGAAAALPESGAALAPSLPVQLSRFFGREEQMQQLRSWLIDADPRLVTVTGLGGTGKTRLAIETARRMAPTFGGRVWFVDLAALPDGRLLPFALAHALHLTLSPQSEPLELIVEKLQEGASLLLLDNFEHLLRPERDLSKSEMPLHNESVLLVRLLLERAAGLRCLITSRQPLHLAGEQELALPPLPIPPTEDRSQEAVGSASPLSPEALLRFPSAALYVDRASKVRPDFALTSNNAEAVAALCGKLEGLPLAIEMAASWVKILTPGKMLVQLETQLDLLVSRRRDLPSRQQSMAATLEWSYDLLEPEQQACFARLSVFRGGWDLEAVQSICMAPGRRGATQAHPSASDIPFVQEAVSLLDALVERSLVICEFQGEEPRYRMLEIVREYAVEKLEKCGEQQELKQRHVEHYLALAEEMSLKLRGPEQGACLDRLTTEHDNLRVALTWCVDEGKREEGKERQEKERGIEALPAAPSLTTTSNPIQDPKSERAQMGLRMAGALWRFWATRGCFSEGRKHLERALKQEGAQAGTAARSRALNGAGILAWAQNDFTAARALFEESLRIKREIGDRQGAADSLGNLGSIAFYQGDYLAARVLLEECLTIKREVGDHQGIAGALNSLGGVALCQSDYALARVLYEESLTLHEALGDKWSVSGALNNLGNVALYRNEHEAAQTFFEKALTIKQEMGDRWGVALTLNNLGNAAYCQGEYALAWARYRESLVISREIGDRERTAQNLEGMAPTLLVQEEAQRAVRLWGAAETLRDSIQAPMFPSDREKYEEQVAQARSVLGEEAFAAAWEEGRRLTWEQAVAYVLGESSELSPNTQRERN